MAFLHAQHAVSHAYNALPLCDVWTSIAHGAAAPGSDFVLVVISTRQLYRHH